MPQLTFRLFGKFEISRDQQGVDSLVTGKARELLCYLLLHRGRPHSRETLAGHFWGDTSTAQSRKYLRKAIWQLQAALGCNQVWLGQRLLQADRDWLVLELNDGARLDVADFEEAFAFTRGACHREMTVEQAHALQAATKLYRGDLLEGWYQDWCLYERERPQNIYLSMLDRLVAYCEAHQQHDQAIDYGERILGHDRPRREFLYRWVEVQVMHSPCEVLRRFEIPLDERAMMTSFAVSSWIRLALQVSTWRCIGSKLLCMRSTPIDTASTRLKRFVCFAKTGVNTPETMSPSLFRLFRSLAHTPNELVRRTAKQLEGMLSYPSEFAPLFLRALPTRQERAWCSAVPCPGVCLEATIQVLLRPWFRRTKDTLSGSLIHDLFLEF